MVVTMKMTKTMVMVLVVITVIERGMMERDVVAVAPSLPSSKGCLVRVCLVGVCRSLVVAPSS